MKAKISTSKVKISCVFNICDPAPHMNNANISEPVDTNSFVCIYNEVAMMI